MRTSILLAAAAATTLVLLSVGTSAMAQSMGGPMMSSPPPKATTAPARRGAVAPRKRPAARGYLPRGGKGPGRCGTYMFWKGGKCVDARLPRK